MSEDWKVSYAKLQEIWQQKLSEHLAKPGWSVLENIDSVWDAFYAKFNFRPSTSSEDWPGIAEPVPSRTYRIGHVFGPDYDQLTRELSDFYLACFKSIVPKGNLIIVLDWQHDCFAFDPHAGFEFEHMEDWPITPLPNGDYYIFLTEDLSGGFFGHPWEQTICVLGDAFVSQLDTAPKDVFANVIRINGESV